MHTDSLDIKEFRCYEVKIEESEKVRSRRCSATDVTVDNH